jgi:LCP family protein required for cell wall assembly
VLWAVPTLLVVVIGLAVGLYIYVLTQVTAGSVAQRHPGLFGWPLRVADRVNVLVIGVDVTYDHRRRILNVARADTLLLVSFDPERRRIVAVSIPRDTRVEIPGVGTTKVNASFAYGGHNLTIRTVERLMAVRVHYYVKLGPDSFKNVIDALGGLEVDVEKDMQYTDTWAGLHIDLKQGRQRLSGEQVAGYIRFRHDALGDIGRVERQRKVLQLLIAELKEPATLLAGPRLLQAFVRNTETNLSPTQLVALGLFAARAGGLETHTLPGGFAPQYWEPDFSKIRPLVAELYYGITAAELAAMPVEVVNASGTPGLGVRAAARLREVGFRQVSVRAAPAPNGRTTVVVRTPRASPAYLAAAALGRASVRHQPGAPGAALTVLLARDAVGAAHRTAIGRAGPD